MKIVDELSIEQKLAELKKSIIRAKEGISNPESRESDFVSNSKLGEDKLESINYYMSIIEKTKSIINGKLYKLDYDTKEQAIKTINKELTNALLVFPGYLTIEELKKKKEIKLWFLFIYYMK